VVDSIESCTDGTVVSYRWNCSEYKSLKLEHIVGELTKGNYTGEGGSEVL